MSASDVTISSPIEKKIAWAEDCNRKLRENLLSDKTVFDLLGRLRSAIQASHKAIKDSGILPLCMECDQDEGGSCCGAGLEDRYDGWLLLINLLLDVRLPKERRDSKSCIFLEKTGCLLQARHVICVNYVCKKITDRINPLKINVLREKEGEELNLLFLLNEQFKRALRDT
jgi:hypothetical protein